MDDVKLISNLGYLAEFDEQRAAEAPNQIRRDAAAERAVILRLAARRLMELTPELSHADRV